MPAKPAAAQETPAKPKRERLVFNMMSEPMGCGGLFLDSGAFSLFAKQLKENPDDLYAWYGTKAYWDYVDEYIRFLKKHGAMWELYANVDVIMNAELSWKTLKYIEAAGLKPVPVLHFGTKMEWVRKHIDAGYEYIGLGGFSSKVTSREKYLRWLHGVFAAACDSKGMPRVKFHGFAVTSWSLLVQFPWWSVDSASWVKASAFGGVYVPRKTGGEFNFLRAPYCLQMSSKSASRNTRGQHFETINKQEQSIILEWLAQVGVTLGSLKEDGEIDEKGVSSHYAPRVRANLVYFEALAAHLPEWPWRYRPANLRTGFLDLS